MLSPGKYRLRTRVRGVLPDRLAFLAPKGSTDCGSHDWYRADRKTARCYHCEVGELEITPKTRIKDLYERRRAGQAHAAGVPT
jgi:hypothetical protein